MSHVLNNVGPGLNIVVINGEKNTQVQHSAAFKVGFVNGIRKHLQFKQFKLRLVKPIHSYTGQ